MSVAYSGKHTDTSTALDRTSKMHSSAACSFASSSRPEAEASAAKRKKQLIGVRGRHLAVQPLQQDRVALASQHDYAQSPAKDVHLSKTKVGRPAEFYGVGIIARKEITQHHVDSACLAQGMSLAS